jgi:predicted nucleic acid-binding protein
LAKALDQKEIFLSVISEMELLSYPKITEVEIERIKAFVADCNLLELTPSIKDKTITIRRNYNLKLPDAIIAATAIQANISLISADSMFKRIKELNFVEYIIS